MEELALSCYGVDVRLTDAAALGLCKLLRERLPPEFVPPSGPQTAPISYIVAAATLPDAEERKGYRITRDGVEVLTVPADRHEDLFRWLRRDLDYAVARSSREMLFVHAGVVAWRGLAILIPGYSGTLALIEALVRRGAVYYSDEFAVLDSAGMVHSYARAITSREDEGLPHDLRLDWAGAPREPLPVSVIVTGTCQPESVWRPAVLRGPDAVRPLIDHAVLATGESDRTQQTAVSIASSVVTLQGPWQDADEVAARLLEVIDIAFASQAFDSDEQGRNRLTADLAGVAVAHLASNAVQPLPLRRLVAARHVLINDFLSPEDHQRLVDCALACEEGFEKSELRAAEGDGAIDAVARQSNTVCDDRLGEAWNLFDAPLRALLPAVRQELGIAWFPLGAVERQLTAHNGDGLYLLPTDKSNPTVDSRRICCVYYFCAGASCIKGGELKLYDTWITDGRSAIAQSSTILDPIENSVVFFQSDTVHEVCPVHPGNTAFRNSRFAVTIWFHQGALPATLTAASDAMRAAAAVDTVHDRQGETDPRRAGAAVEMGADHLLRQSALMRNRGIDLVLDVGANVGQFGSILRERIGFRGRIVSFEPLRDAFAQLRGIAAQDGAWSCHNLALGDDTGSAMINVSANSHSSSFLMVNDRTLEIEPSAAPVGRETVTLRRLDDVFDEVVRATETPYLKIDAQGDEIRVLKGGLRVLERCPLIQLETSFFPVYKDQPLIGEVIQFLASLGYRVVSIEPGWHDTKTGELLQADLIFARG